VAKSTRFTARSNSVWGMPSSGPSSAGSKKTSSRIWVWKKAEWPFQAMVPSRIASVPTAVAMATMPTRRKRFSAA
jgi:hypothetical protein